jgi:hypothetical protein
MMLSINLHIAKLSERAAAAAYSLPASAERVEPIHVTQKRLHTIATAADVAGRPFDGR